MKKNLAILLSLILFIGVSTQSYADTSSCEVSVVVIKRDIAEETLSEGTSIEDIKEEKTIDLFLDMAEPPLEEHKEKYEEKHEKQDIVQYEENQEETKNEESKEEINEVVTDTTSDNTPTPPNDTTEHITLDEHLAEIPIEEAPTTLTFEDILRKVIWMFYKGNNHEYQNPGDIPGKIVKSVFYYSTTGAVMLFGVMIILIIREIKRKTALKQRV